MHRRQEENGQMDYIIEDPLLLFRRISHILPATPFPGGIPRNIILDKILFMI